MILKGDKQYGRVREEAVSSTITAGRSAATKVALHARLNPNHPAHPSA